MDRRHLAAVTVATAGCLALSLLVARLRPFSGNGSQAEAASDTVLGVSSTPALSDGEPADRSPEVYQGSVFFRSSEAMLKDLGVTVYPQDKVYAFPDPALGIGSTLKVYRAQPVSVKDGKSTQVYRTWSATVGDLLTERDIEVGAKDVVTPAPSTPIALGSDAFAITIVRVAETNLSVDSPIDYGVTYQDDPTQIVGQTSVKTAGVPGTLRKTYLVRREDGVEVSRTLLSSQTVKQPVNEVILRGTKPKVQYLSSGQYSAYLNEAAAKYSVSAASLQKVMVCESGGNVNSVNSGLYYGLFQFDKQTWSTTAYASRDILDPEAQIMAAASLWQWRSAKWPSCSRGI